MSANRSTSYRTAPALALHLDLHVTPNLLRGPVADPTCLALFCQRYLIPAEKWPERWAKVCFWSTNIGLAWMCFATLLPLGILQLYKSVNDGYFEARELKFLTNDTNALLEWLRLPGDIVFIGGGAIPALYIAYIGIRHTVKRTTLEEPEDILFTEIAQPDHVPAMDHEEAAAARLT